MDKFFKRKGDKRVIIFVGSNIKGAFAEDVAKERGFDFGVVAEKGDIKAQVNDILFEAQNRKVDCIIFDIEQYINDADVIADSINSISAALNAKAIVYAPSFISGSTLTTALAEKGINNFIKFGYTTDMKDQLEKNIVGFYDVNKRKEISEIENEKLKTEETIKGKKTIAVAGAMHRIGTTTQAIQIVKYLKFKGYKACYIELNDNKYMDRDESLKHRQVGYTQKVKAWLDINKADDELGVIKYADIEMYYKQNTIPHILKMDYDYIVYDFGVYSERAFNRTAFVQADIKIMVVGNDPAELDWTQELAQSSFYQDAKLLFSFTGMGEAEEIKLLMDNIKTSNNKSNGARCYFADFVPDPFIFSNLKLFDELIGALGTEEATPTQNKKGFSWKKPGISLGIRKNKK